MTDNYCAFCGTLLHTVRHTAAALPGRAFCSDRCLAAYADLLDEPDEDDAGRPRRYAVVRGPLATIERYLPANYAAQQPLGDLVLIAGHDHAGWTLDGYVIPRLASGLYAAREVAR